MAAVHLVIAVALVEYLFFGMAVGHARMKYDIMAPATAGNEHFERYYRVQMNTLEQLVVFVPAILMFAHYLSAPWAAGLGALFVIGRAIYFRDYVRNPKKRGTGFGIAFLPMLVLLAGAVLGAVRALAT